MEKIKAQERILELKTKINELKKEFFNERYNQVSGRIDITLEDLHQMDKELIMYLKIQEVIQQFF